MTVLAPPTCIGPEPAVAGMRFPNASCLQLSVSSVLADLGMRSAPQYVDLLFRPSPTGHTVEEASSVFGMLGVSTSYNDGSVPASVYIPQALAQHHECIIEFQCDGLARPVPRGTSTIRHFVVCYGYDGLRYFVMQSWTGTLQTIPTAVLESSETQQHITINQTMAKDTGDTMLTIGAKREKARSWYAMYCGRDPDSQAAEDAWAASIADDGSNLDAVALSFRQTPESQNWMAKVRAVALNPPAFIGTQPDAQLVTDVGKIKAALGVAGSTLTGASS